MASTFLAVGSFHNLTLQFSEDLEEATKSIKPRYSNIKIKPKGTKTIVAGVTAQR